MTRVNLLPPSITPYLPSLLPSCLPPASLLSAKTFPLDRLMAALDTYMDKTGNKVFIE